MSALYCKPLLDLLIAYQRAWPDERAVAQRTRNLISEHEDCFERTCQPGHITGSAWVVSEDSQRFLLLHHKKLDKWLQPGGHADGETDIANVARREVLEESGLSEIRLLSPMPLDLDIHIIPDCVNSYGELIEQGHEHHDIRFLFKVEGDSTLVLSDESNELRWCTAEEVRSLTDEWSVLRLLEKSIEAMLSLTP